MDATLDKFGRIVLPKAVRDSLGLDAGTELVVEQRAGEIVLKPAETGPPLAVKDGILVYCGKPAGDLGRAVATHRRARLRNVGGGAGR